MSYSNNKITFVFFQQDQYERNVDKILNSGLKCVLSVGENIDQNLFVNLLIDESYVPIKLSSPLLPKPEIISEVESNGREFIDENQIDEIIVALQQNGFWEKKVCEIKSIESFRNSKSGELNLRIKIEIKVKWQLIRISSIHTKLVIELFVVLE